MIKKIVLILSVFVTASSYAQNFTTGFDSPEEQNMWTEYRLDGTTPMNWTFSSSQYSSSPNSLFHDFPMGQNVEDWFVSPKLYFTDFSSSITINSYLSSLSSVPNIYYGLWISYGSRDPSDGEYFELTDLTQFPTTQNVWEDTTINFTPQSDSVHIAIKYKANDYEWLMIWIDDLIVENTTTKFPTVIYDKRLKGNDITVYPNPTTGVVKIEGGDVKIIDVYNFYGQKVFSFSETTEIDLNSLSNGIYFINVSTSDKIKTTKIIVN